MSTIQAPATPKPRSPEKVLRDTAYHEAGHAVFCLQFRRRFKYVTIVPKEDSLGHLLQADFAKSFRPDVEVTPNTERTIHNYIQVLMAGGQAAKRISGRVDWHGCSADMTKAVHFATYLYPDDVAGPYIDFCIAQTAFLVRSPLIWIRIEAVAKALLDRKHLSYRDCIKVCKAASEDQTRLDALFTEQIDREERISRREANRIDKDDVERQPASAAP